jgi:GT2 family glycosyltransferase
MTVITLQPSDSPRASVLVLSRRDAPMLQACLSSLARNIRRDVPFEVIVLLNGADEDVAALCAERVVGARVERSRVNLGFPAGTNRAAAHARGEFLVLLNDDTEIEPGWLDSLIGTADEHPRAGAIGSRILFPDGSVQEAGGVIWSDGTTAQVGRGLPPASLRHLFVREVDYCSGASLLVRRSTWRLVGGLDEDYFPGYYEDVDLCLAIRELGQQVLYEPRSRVVHHESGTLDDGLRARVAERNVQRLRSKWSAQLAAREPGGPASAAAVDRAALRAQGRPQRILVIGAQLPDADLIRELRGIPGAVVVLAEGVFHDDAESLARLGCDIIQDDLTEHLATPEILYHAVILHGSADFRPHIAAVREHQPQAAVVHDATRLDEPVELQVDHVVREPGAWPDALAQAKSRRVHEYV